MLPLNSTKIIDRLEAENRKLHKQLMEHREALVVLSQLRTLYNISPNMHEPRTESTAKLMMKQAEEGLRLAQQRTQDEYIRELQAELKTKDKALELSLEWLDEVCNPDNNDMKTEQGVAVRRQIEQAMKGGK